MSGGTTAISPQYCDQGVFMRIHIHRKGFDRFTGMAWLLCYPADDSGMELFAKRYTYLLSRRSPNVLIQPGYDPPQILKRTAEGWVEYEKESKIDMLGIRFMHTLGTSRLIGADEELDYLHVALLSVVPHPLLVSFAQRSRMVYFRFYRTLKKIMSKIRANPNQEKRNRWELCHAVIKHLGRGWQVDASALQIGCGYMGMASGPDGMRLMFALRTENLDPRMEHCYPPFGWLRVNGRLPFNDGGPFTDLSIELRESLPAEEIGNELILRFLPLYADVLGIVQKHNSQPPEVGSENRQ